MLCFVLSTVTNKRTSHSGSITYYLNGVYSLIMLLPTTPQRPHSSGLTNNTSPFAIWTKSNASSPQTYVQFPSTVKSKSLPHVSYFLSDKVITFMPLSSRMSPIPHRIMKESSPNIFRLLAGRNQQTHLAVIQHFQRS